MAGQGTERKEPVSTPTRAVALEDGFINGLRIRKGTEFLLPVGMRPGRWMLLLKDGETAPEKPKALREKQVAFSEITKKMGSTLV